MGVDTTRIAPYTHSMIGTRLRVKRRQQGLTQLDLAERSGITQASIARIEGGRQEPTPHTVKALADALGVPIQSLEEG